MLTRGNTTIDVTDETTYWPDTKDNNCTNGTYWNGTNCTGVQYTEYKYPESGIATFLIFPQKEAGQDAIILGAPFLDDYYQVYSLDRNVVGLVPSIDVNPENGEGYYTSSKPENVHEDDRLIIIIISCLALFFGGVFRNAVMGTCYTATFAAAMAPKGYAALEGGELDEEEDD